MHKPRLGHVFGIVGLALGGLVTGCSAPAKSQQPLLLFPPPPHKPRVQFLTWASGSEEVELPTNMLDDFLLGENTTADEQIQKPYGVAARDGVIYVCDTKDLCLAKLDFKNNSYSTFGTRGPGRLRKPINIVIDPLGYKFVADPVRKQIVVYGPDDAYVTVLDVPAPCHPVDVAVHENELYVLDNDDTPQVVVMNRTTGEVLRTFGELGTEPGQFRIPGSLTVGPDGYVYVSDTQNYRIQKLTRHGEPVWVRGAPGYRLGRFGRLRGVRTGPDGIIYIADGATEIVQMFNSDGEILMHFGGPGNVPGALVLPSTLAVDKTSIPYFQKYIHEKFNTEYLLIVASQYGQHLISVYAFGSFPEGFKLEGSQIASLPDSQGLGIAPIGGSQDPGTEGKADSEAEQELPPPVLEEKGQD
ncbi:MAG: hypothetical protein JSU63_19680 [Phycisphaerales bacterium]|nr:MAG: hypothetical protein JSU63_19680 [Phycisphaerales bacterium]